MPIITCVKMDKLSINVQKMKMGDIAQITKWGSDSEDIGKWVIRNGDDLFCLNDPEGGWEDIPWGGDLISPCCENCEVILLGPHDSITLQNENRVQ